MNSIVELLASSQGSRKSDANISLAEAISSSGNAEAVTELAGLLRHKDRNLQSDAIKVLYETGFRNPGLIAKHWQEFVALLSSKNNRLVWGAMAALTTMVHLRHKALFGALDQIMQAVDNGSVITIDCGVEILAKLNGFATYHPTTDPLLREQLSACPIKQLPTYARKTLEHLGDLPPGRYLRILEKRLEECEKESQKKKLMQLISKTGP